MHILPLPHTRTFYTMEEIFSKVYFIANRMVPSCKILLLLLSFNALMSTLVGQSTDPARIKAMIERFKTDPRGPYKDIRWYCKDGTIREARDPCPGTKAGHQHASFKPEVIALAEDQHIFLGPILASTPKEDFWDAGNSQSR